MGNCFALSTSKLIFTEGSGGPNEQPFHSDGDDNKNGSDGRTRRDRCRSRSSKCKEAEDFSSLTPAASCKNRRGGVVRVKLVITKQELAELLSDGLAKRGAMKDRLLELQAKLGDQSTALYIYPYEENCGTAAQINCHSIWRPSFDSIAEDKNSNNN